MKDFFDKDLYEILQIKKCATLKEIKEAYKRLVRINHPDINSDAADIFKEVCRAYDILSDPVKKNLYDIKNGFNQNSEEKKLDDNTEVLKNNEIHKYSKQKNNKTFSGLLTEIIDGIFVNVKKSSQSSKKSSKGEDIFANVTISAKEALFGTTRIINIMQTALCPNCTSKKFINESVCSLCKGTGEISNHKRINANIPANTQNGARIKIDGAGNQSPKGGKNGDLYLIISIDEKSLFTVKDNIVYLDLPISAYEAALGANILIPTFYEDITIKIPPNTSSGQKFRINGHGIYDKISGKNGDMIITVFIKIPPKLSSKEIELYKQLRELSDYDIREGLKDNE